MRCVTEPDAKRGLQRHALHPCLVIGGKASTASVRQQTADLVEESRIRLHDHVAAVNSSMAFGFNLFMPFREYGASALEELLGRSVGFPVRVVDIVGRGELPPNPERQALAGELVEDIESSKDPAVADALGISRQTLYDILNEKQPVTAEMAVRFGKLFGNGGRFWVNLQRSHDLAP